MKHYAVDLTARQWELYTHSMDCSEAARALNQAAERALNTCATADEARELVHGVMADFAPASAPTTPSRAPSPRACSPRAGRPLDLALFSATKTLAPLHLLSYIKSHRKRTGEQQMTRNQSAAQTYDAAYQEVLALAAQIQKAAEQHRARQQQQPSNWGFAGDLHAVHGHLAEALRMLQGVSK